MWDYPSDPSPKTVVVYQPARESRPPSPPPRQPREPWASTSWRPPPPAPSRFRRAIALLLGCAVAGLLIGGCGLLFVKANEQHRREYAADLRYPWPHYRCNAGVLESKQARGYGHDWKTIIPVTRCNP